MKTFSRALAATWLAAGVAVGAQTVLTRTFDRDKAGAPPAGFTFAVFRGPEAGRWLVRGQRAGQYVVHVATPGVPGYAMAVAEGAAAGNQVASVRLRLAGGGRAGGLVWRYRDPQNFYAAVLDLGAGNLGLYRVSSGDLIRLEFEDDLELDVNAWHTLKVSHDGEEISVSLGGIRVFRDNGRRNRTGGPGLVGLLARADADVWFDDLRVDRRR